MLGQKVGIGTASLTAALEVVGSGGDDSVKLPAGSIGIGEPAGQLSAANLLSALVAELTGTPHHGKVWKVGAQPLPLTITTLLNEQQLEDMIVSTPQILSSEWMLIGRQEQTGLGGRIDLLAIAPDASLVLIELKRDRTPREIVAQALDYASWVERSTADQIAQIYRRFSSGGDLGAAFQVRILADLNVDEIAATSGIL